MSLLHPFYCRGYLAVVLSTTLFFALFGKANWHVLPFFFALIPITCSILFLCIGRLNTLENNGCSKRFSEFGKNSIFLILFLLMICAGAGEQVIAQWASFFAEKGLGGGTLMFAILALAGDVGATPAPPVAGEVSALTNVSTGILTGTIFHVASLILLMLYAKSIKAKNSAPRIER